MEIFYIALDFSSLVIVSPSSVLISRFPGLHTLFPSGMSGMTNLKRGPSLRFPMAGKPMKSSHGKKVRDSLNTHSDNGPKSSAAPSKSNSNKSVVRHPTNAKQPYIQECKHSVAWTTWVYVEIPSLFLCLQEKKKQQGTKSIR